MVFENKDPAAPHNVAFKDAPPGAPFIGEIIQAGQTTTYQVPAIPAGRYEFFCSVHPNMVGSLTAE
jgi:plastocyanin